MNWMSPVAISSETFSFNGSEYSSHFRRIFWFRDSEKEGTEGYAHFWAVVLKFHVLAIDSYRVTEVITLGSCRIPPTLDERGNVTYQVTGHPVKHVTRWQLEETARLTATLSRQTMTALFAGDYAARNDISLKQAFDMVKNDKVPQDIKDFSKHKRLFQHVWDDQALIELVAKREELWKVREERGGRHKEVLELAEWYGVAPKTIKKRLKHARDRGFLLDRVGKSKTKRKGTHGKSKKARR